MLAHLFCNKGLTLLIRRHDTQAFSNTNDNYTQHNNKNMPTSYTTLSIMTLHTVDAVMLSAVILSVVMLSVVYSECRKISQNKYPYLI